MNLRNDEVLCEHYRPKKNLQKTTQNKSQFQKQNVSNTLSNVTG